jgi:DMSO reductase anchor subunit
MHPALSVIVFTTFSGAGYGLLFLIGILAGNSILPDSRWFAFFGLGLSLGLATLGLLASTYHLGRPERAWRAFSQWRTSWLSREGILSLAVFVPAGILGVAWLFFGHVLTWAGWLSALLAVPTIFCTAMIYASLKTVPRWHNAWVPLNYLLLGLMNGALLLQGLLHPFAAATPASAWLAIVATLAGALGKLGYWRHIDRARPASTAGSATGLGAMGEVRLLEAPHSEDNYLMKEMGHRIARKHAGRLRRIALGLGFAAPLLLTILALLSSGLLAGMGTVLAAGLAMLGTLIERWLFFAEAKHSVTLYYGAAAV